MNEPPGILPAFTEADLKQNLSRNFEGTEVPREKSQRVFVDVSFSPFRAPLSFAMQNCSRPDDMKTQRGFILNSPWP
jgi:hypothetical protein